MGSLPDKSRTENECPEKKKIKLDDIGARIETSP